VRRGGPGEDGWTVSEIRVATEIVTCSRNFRIKVAGRHALTRRRGDVRPPGLQLTRNSVGRASSPPPPQVTVDPPS